MNNRIIVTYEGKMPDDTGDYLVNNITDTKSLESFSLSTGTRIGMFPALVDLTAKKWLPIDDTIVNIDIKLDTLIQESKSTDQKIYENKFFDLCKLILTTVGDPRATLEVTPKLGFNELSALIEGFEVTDFNASVKFSLKLLSLDASLKRFDILWWDNAIYHTGSN